MCQSGIANLQGLKNQKSNKKKTTTFSSLKEDLRKISPLDSNKQQYSKLHMTRVNMLNRSH